MKDVFVGSEAVAQGKLSPYELRSRFRAIYPDIYVPDHAAPSLRTRSVAAWLWSKRRGVLAGLAAAALHGAAWVDDDEPVELIWRNPHPPDGVVTCNFDVEDDEVTRIAGLPVTTTARTAYDLGRFLPRDKAVARMDALMHARAFSAEDVVLLAKRHAGARGLRRLRVALPLVDGGAASPKETWLRLLLIDAGFPAPETQIPVLDGFFPVGWVDMGWRQYRVAAEYDGDHHRKDRRTYVKDQRRARRIAALGWSVVRVIAEDRRDDIIKRVDAALAGRGYHR
jgi:hypothetical protein